MARFQERGVIKRAYYSEKSGAVYVDLRTYRYGDWSLNFPGDAARQLSALEGKEVDLTADISGDVGQNEVKLQDGRSFNAPNQRVTVLQFEVKEVAANGVAAAAR
jgi:hypothetical protein